MVVLFSTSSLDFSELLSGRNVEIDFYTVSSPRSKPKLEKNISMATRLSLIFVDDFICFQMIVVKPTSDSNWRVGKENQADQATAKASAGHMNKKSQRTASHLTNNQKTVQFECGIEENSTYRPNKVSTKSSIKARKLGRRQGWLWKQLI